MQNSQKLLPANCPIDLPPDALQPNPAVDTLFDVAIGVEAHNGAVNDILLGEKLSINDSMKAVGHVACASCAYVEKCKDVVSEAEQEIAPQISHPLDLISELEPESVTRLWGASIVAHAVEAGYSRESSANMVGRISKLSAPSQAIVYKVLETDPARIPVQAGKAILEDDVFELIDFGDIRLLLSDSAAKSLSGDGNYLEGFIAKTAKAFMRSETRANGDPTKITKLRNALETNYFKDLSIKPLKGLQHVMEFNGQTQTNLRGFGAVIGQNPRYDGSLDTIVIAHVADAKGGENGTNIEAAKVAKLVKGLSAEKITEAIADAKEDKTITTLETKSRRVALVTS